MSPVALFDLDGTLIDSRPGIVASLRSALRSLGHTIDPSEDFSWMIGPPIEQTIGTLLARWDDRRTAEAVAIYRRNYGETGMYDTTVYPGIPAALAALIEARWTLFVATAKRTRYARPILEHFGLARYFRAVYGSEDGPLRDTKPELLAHLLAEERLDGADAVMIGDRHYDLEGARAAGMRSIGVAWGYGGTSELQAAGAGAIAYRPAELPGLAERLLGVRAR